MSTIRVVFAVDNAAFISAPALAAPRSLPGTRDLNRGGETVETSRENAFWYGRRTGTSAEEQARIALDGVSESTGQDLWALGFAGLGA